MNAYDFSRQLTHTAARTLQCTGIAKLCTQNLWGLFLAFSMSFGYVLTGASDAAAARSPFRITPLLATGHPHHLAQTDTPADQDNPYNPNPVAIASGPDGNLWVTEAEGEVSSERDDIAKVSTAGAITVYPLPVGTNAWGIASGPDGNVWFTERGTNEIARITPTGIITAFAIPSPNADPHGITSGADGNLWFAEATANKIGRITPNGHVTEYLLPTSNAVPTGITSGPDGDVWFTETNASQIGRITPTGVITEFPLPGHVLPDAITEGPDGNLWFTEGGPGKIGRMTPAGVVSEFPVLCDVGTPSGITNGPDGNLWFTEQDCGQVGSITTSGVVTEYVASSTLSPVSIAKGADGALWFADTYTGDPGNATTPTGDIGRVTTSGTVTHFMIPGPRLDCSNPVDIATVSSGENVLGAALLESDDGEESAESEPLDVELNGTVEAQVTQYGDITPFSFTASAAGSVAVCIEGFDGDEGAAVQLRPVGGAPGPLESLGNINYCERCFEGAFGVASDPVNTDTGNFSESFTDFQIPSRGLPFSFIRTYNSLAAGQNSPLGYGWTSNVDMSLSEDSSSNVTISQENGAQVTFSPQGGGGYSAPPRVAATLVKNSDGTFTFTRLNQQIFNFSASGQLLWEQDLNGYRTQFGYNPSNQLTSITDPAGRQILFSYTGSHIASITDPAGRVVSFTYDGQGNLSQATDVGGGAWTFTYDSNHLLLTAADPRGGVLTNTYDSLGRVTQQTDAMGRTTTFSYTGDNDSATGGSTTITDPRGNVTVDTYAFGLRLASTEGYGSADAATWMYSYDPVSLCESSVLDPLGHLMTNTCYANGNLLSTTDPLGRTTTHTYNALNELTSTTDPLGVTTDMTYDTNGNLVSKTEDGHGPTTSYVSRFQVQRMAHRLEVRWRLANQTGVVGFFVYAGSHRLTAIIPVRPSRNYSKSIRSRRRPPYRLEVVLATGREAWYSPTSWQRRSAVQDASPASSTTTYSYDDPNHPGDVTSMTDPNGNTWTYTYDAYGDKTSTADPLGDTTTDIYNNIAELQSETSPNGNVSGANPTLYTTTYHYDPFGDVTQVTDPLGHITSHQYDADQNLISTTDGDGNTATYSHDANNELTQTQRANGTVTRTDYDSDGNVVGQIDGAGNETSYTYDPLDHLASVTDSLGRVTNYEYDADGNLDSRGNSDGTTTYGYDADSELTSISYSDAVTPNVSMSYDADGQRIVMTDGTGVSSWTYDALNRLTSSTNGADAEVDYGYDGNGNLTSITYPNGQAVDRTFDSANRLASVTDWLGNTTAFGYDADSNLVSETFPSSTDEVDNSTYNGADQITGISDREGMTTLASFSYSRDADNQVNSATETGVPAAATHAYAYTPLNQLQSDNANSYTYDSADNITGLPSGATLSYDAANELTSLTQSGSATTFTYNDEGDRTAETPSSGTGSTFTYDEADRLTGYSNGTVSATYAYNGDGLRISKTVNGTVEPFVWDAAESPPVPLQDGSSIYVYGPSDLPLEQIPSSNAVLYYHHDQLGTTRFLSNAQGTVDASYTFDAYGNLRSSTGSVTNPFLYAGQYTDAESRLQYLQARYYDPSTGQFLTVDPAQAVTMSPYAYVAGDPMQGTDPTGLGWCGQRNVSQSCSTVPGGSKGATHTCLVVGNGSTDTVTVFAGVPCSALDSLSGESGPQYTGIDPDAEGATPGNQTCSFDPGTGLSHCTTPPGKVEDKITTTIGGALVDGGVAFCVGGPIAVGVTAIDIVHFFWDLTH